jgi:RHS repeat-associated protein
MGVRKSETASRRVARQALGRLRRVSRGRRRWLMPVVILTTGLAMITGTFAVVSMSSETAFDAAGRAAKVKLDQVPTGERPKATTGVKLDEPGTESGEQKPAADRPPLKAEKVCGEATEQDELVGIKAGSKVCRNSETSQSPDLADAAPFKLMNGAQSAPDPEVPDDLTDEPTPTETPSATPSTTPDPTPGVDETEEPPFSTPGPSPPAVTDEATPDDSAPQNSDQRHAQPAAYHGAAKIQSAVAPMVQPSGSENYLSPNWTQASTPTQPDGLLNPAMAYDPVRDKVVLFGGNRSNGTFSNETWVWSGTGWAKLTPATSPSARSGAAMAWNPVLNTVVMYGGRTNLTAVAGDVWSWNGTTWTQLTPTGTAPVARAEAAMAFDPVRGGLVIFGGRTSTADRNDTWQLKANAWTQLQADGAGGAPARRSKAGLAYSTSTSQLVLFGGGVGSSCPSCTGYGDTWILGAAASSWSQQTPTHSPPARLGHAMTFDPGIGGIVLFGGASGDGTTTTTFNDTWAWTGADWLHASGIASPGSRAGAAMAATNDGQMVLFGGAISTSTPETWTYDTALPILSITVGAPSGNVFYIGDSLQISISATNVGITAIDASHGATVTALLDQVGLTAGSQVKINNVLAVLCSGLIASTCALVNESIASVTNLEIAPLATRVIDLVATVASTQRGCALVDVPALVSSVFGGSASVSTQITVCGGGLGIEKWWSYDTTDLGSGGTASVNVANGNLVVKQTDSTPVQTRGRLAMALGRSYNSQALMSSAGPLGAGWQFDIGDAGETAGAFGIAGLSLPSLQTASQPLSVPYVDRDGTRHIFKLRSAGAAIGDASLPIDLSSGGGLVESLLKLLNLETLPFTLSSAVEGLVYSNLCIDQAYTGPPGSNMFLFRFIGVGNSSGCGNPASAAGLTVGWSMVLPDRTRYDFNALGNLERVTDATGQQLVYTYTNGVTAGPTSIYAKACGNTGTCPRIRINYNVGNAGIDRRHVKVTDSAGRITSYIVTTDPLYPQLLQVWEPGNPFSTVAGTTPSQSFTYSIPGTPCPGSVSGATSLGQLCSVTDANGAATRFSYQPAPIGPDRVDKVIDRRGTVALDGAAKGLATTYTYHDDAEGQPSWVTADMAAPSAVGACAGNAACERVRYSDIDSAGRVAQIAEGSSDDVYLRQTGYFWDGGAIETCSHPTDLVNNNLCQTIRRAVPSSAPFVPNEASTSTVNGVTVHDEAVDFTYGDLGQLLRRKVLLDASQAWTDDNSSITTYGSHDQYFDANGTQRAYDNYVRGDGKIGSSSSSGNYRAVVMGDDPVGYWRLGETSGTTMASETGDNDGSYFSGVTLGQAGITLGNAAIGERQNDSSGQLNSPTGLPHGTTVGGSDFTVESWVRTSGTGSDIAAQWGTGGNQFVRLGRTSGGLPMVTIGTNVALSEGAIVISPVSVSDGDYHHVVYTYDGSGSAAGIAIWIDGVKSPTSIAYDTMAGGAYSGTPNYLILGYGSDPGALLDEVAVYDEVLPAGRIRSHSRVGSGADRIEPDTLYAVTDQTQELSPRGNAATNWGDYLTTIRRDFPADGEVASTNDVADTYICGAADVGNTGLPCEVDIPASNDVAAGSCQAPTSGVPTGTGTPPTSGSYAHTCTTYEYNTAGQRTVMRTPKAHQDGSPDRYEYAYYDDVTSCSTSGGTPTIRNCDLSGSVSAGGWLKAVTDPNGKKVVYAYDAAGSVARTWDRNATEGHALSEAWTDPVTPPSAKFTESVGSTPVTSDALSVSNTALITVAPDGTAFGSGANASGELGDTTTTARPTGAAAASVSNVVRVAQSALGASMGCAYTIYRTGSGDVWAAGGGLASTPAKVSGIADIIQVAVGGCHTLALDAAGGLWVFGQNAAGQVGNGTTSTVLTPVKVLDDVASIGAGSQHTLAVKTDGTVWAWGNNASGQLGLGNTTSGHTAPSQVPGLSGVRAVAGGVDASYAIGRDGSVYAWGANASGQLGIGNTTAKTSPTRITTLGAGTAIGAVRQIIGGNTGAAALLRDGTVRAWGLGSSGQLGAGTASANAPTAVPGVTGQVAIAGGWNTLATANRAGRITVWGATANHQRGTGTNPATSTPVAAGIDISPYRLPWRFTRGTRTPAGDLSTAVVDKLGNVRSTRPGRGNDVFTTAYDFSSKYDAAQRQIWSITAENRAGAKNASTDYDAFGNPVKSTDARGVAFRSTFDAVNRQLASKATRGTVGVPSTCTETAATSSWTAGQNGHKICTSSATYDGLDRQVTATDANSQVTKFWADAASRTLRQDVPRNADGYTVLSTRQVYDRDGNVTDVCPPRQFDATNESSTTTGCTSTGVHSSHQVFDRTGRVTSQTKYRSSTALTSAFKYDADGNVVSSTDANNHETKTEYNLLGRRTRQTVPRSAAVDLPTTWTYDPAGNIVTVRSPGSLNTGSGANGNLVIDGTTAASSTDGVAHGAANPFPIPDGAQYRNVTLQNGGRVTAANANGLMFHATGTVKVCSTCVITMVGKGQAGGAAGAAAANPNPGNGGKAGANSLIATGSGGGGGGHKTAGTAGTGSSGGLGGAAGLSSGTSDFSDVGTDYLKGSGGGGGGGGKGILAVNAGVGGKGGGYIRITASEIVVDGLVDASGADGGTGVGNAAGGGGGAGGGVWLAAADITLASPAAVDVTGGVGGGPVSRAGGPGAEGFVRVDGDTVPIKPAGVSDVNRAARFTAYSYDANNRVVDIVEGAQTTQADVSLDNSVNAAPDANGLDNTRTRHFYDADGQISAILPPQAFSNAASLTAPNLTTIRRVDHDLDGREVASYSPRYDTAVTAVNSIGAGDDGDAGINQQTAQCTTDRVVDAVPGLGSYAATVGVCVARTTYDPVGNIARQYLPTSNGSDNRYLENTYTPDNLVRVISGPDPNSSGRVDVATNEYDGAGQSTKSTDALGHNAQTSYTADGMVHQTTGQAYTVGSTTVTEINTFGYDANGNPTTATNPKGDVTTQSWTTDNRIAQIKAPGKDGSTFNTTVYGYDNVGNPTSVLMPQQQAGGDKAVVNEFTDDNLLKATHTPITTGSYRSVRYAYAPAGMKVATTTALCSSGTVGDCVPGNPGAWHPSSDAMRLTYGANGRVTDEIGRDSSSITTRYTQDGAPKQVTDPTSGITVAAGFYLDGNVRTVDDGSNENTYAYDAGGQVTVRSDKTALNSVTVGATVSTSYSYNQAGLAGQVSSQVLDQVTAYSYDDAGRLVTETTGDHINELSWHPNDALAGLRTKAGGNTVNDFVYEYDNNGHMTKQVATGDSEKYTNTYAYNPAGNLTEWNHTPDGGSTQSTAYEWDRNNNRTKVTVAGQATSTSYRMDNSVGAVDAPGTASDHTFVYDNAGRLTDDGCNTYTYDDFDRVKQSVISGTTACGGDSRTVAYTYDGLDRQRTVAVTGSTSGNGTTSSIFDGLTSTLVGQKDATNGANSKPEVLYQLDTGGTAMGMSQTGAGAGKSFLDTDGHGNVVNQVTTADARACAVVYDPFGGSYGAAGGAGTNGMCTASTTPATTTGNALWYRGEARDSSTGDYQLGARSYDPATGAFTTPDAYRVASSATDVSVGVDPATANTYSYVNGNPVNYSDPFGHSACDVISGWGWGKKKCDDIGEGIKKGGEVVKDAGASVVGGLLGFEELLPVPLFSMTRDRHGIPMLGLEIQWGTGLDLRERWYGFTGTNPDSFWTKACEIACTLGASAVAKIGAKGAKAGVGLLKSVLTGGADDVAEIVAKNVDDAAEEIATSARPSAPAPKPKTSTKATKPEGSGPVADSAPEVFYRGMSHAEARGLSNTGGLSVRGESFVTQDLGYVQQLAARHSNLYQTITRFEMAPGTTDALLAAGARGSGRLLDDLGLGGMRQIQSGMTDAVHVKAELGAVTYGLRSGSVDVFNSRIVGLGALR